MDAVDRAQSIAQGPRRGEIDEATRALAPAGGKPLTNVQGDEPIAVGSAAAATAVLPPVQGLRVFESVREAVLPRECLVVPRKRIEPADAVTAHRTEQRPFPPRQTLLESRHEPAEAQPGTFSQKHARSIAHRPHVPERGGTGVGAETSSS